MKILIDKLISVYALIIFIAIDGGSEISPYSFSCTASSYYDQIRGTKYSCRSALDANNITSWAANGERVGAWIFIDFKKHYVLSKITLKHRFYYTGYNWNAEIKKVKIQFSDGQSEEKLLSTNFENSVKFANKTKTNSVNITVIDVFNPFVFHYDQKSSIGFSELRFYNNSMATNDGKLISSFISD